MKLQKFVIDVIEAMGGMVIQTEYALCEAIIPEERKEIFQGRTECLLAFDFEVAEENPDAEFVTFGSFIFEQLITFVELHTLSNIRSVEVEHRNLHDPLGKIQRFLDRKNSRIKLLDERLVTTVWVVFAFRVGYVSDEKEQEFQQIWMDLSKGEIDLEMHLIRGIIPYSDKPMEESPPLASNIDLTSALLNAYKYVRQLAEQGREQRMRRGELEREVQRISEYYGELVDETVKRSERKGLTDEKKEELLGKVNTIQAEKEKQLREMESKYTVRVEATLDHGLLYFVPLTEYLIQIEDRKEHEKMRLRYNPLLKKFSILPTNDNVSTNMYTYKIQA